MRSALLYGHLVGNSIVLVLMHLQLAMWGAFWFYRLGLLVMGPFLREWESAALLIGTWFQRRLARSSPTICGARSRQQRVAPGKVLRHAPPYHDQVL